MAEPRSLFLDDTLRGPWGFARGLGRPRVRDVFISYRAPLVKPITRKDTIMRPLWKRQGYFSKYSDHNVAKVARRDGGVTPAIPSWKATQLPPFLWELCYAGETTLYAVEQSWLSIDTTLKPNWEHASRTAHQAEMRADTAKDKLQDAEKAYKDAGSKDAGSKDAPPSDRRFSIYWWGTFILSMLEVPFTAVAFRSIGEGDAMTLVMTCALNGAIVAAAHFLGVAVRKSGKWHDETLSQKVHRGIAVLLGAAVIVVLASISWFRARFISTPKPATGIAHQSLVAHAASSFPQAAAPQFALFPSTIAFLSFSVLLFVVVAVYSFLTHDELLATVFRLRRIHKALHAQHNGKQRTLARTFARREKRHGHFQALAYMTLATVKRLTEHYRTINLQTRDDRAQDVPNDHDRDKEVPNDHDRDQNALNGYPWSFNYHTTLVIPISLKELEWEMSTSNDTKANDTKANDTKANDTVPPVPANAVPTAQLNGFHAETTTQS